MVVEEGGKGEKERVLLRATGYADGIWDGESGEEISECLAVGDFGCGFRGHWVCGFDDVMVWSELQGTA